MNKFMAGAISLLFISTFFLGLSPAQAAIDANFNPSNIISDNEMLDYTSLSLQEIGNFLNERGGYIARYRTTNAYGQVKSAAEIIYEASMNNYNCDGVSLNNSSDITEIKAKCKSTGTINPKVLLVMLQKEMSLLTDTNPKQTQLDWAMGYGCLDGQACNTRWQGFGKQVNSMSLQFKDYMDNAGAGSRYKVGQSYTFSNPYGTIETSSTRVTIANKATAALYNYTPHVYNGNYNFYKLWNEYFPVTLYPNGSLLQADGESGVWLIRDGKKLPFLSKSALTSRFDENKIITVPAAVLNGYSTGDVIKFPNYSIVKAFFTGKTYLLVDDEKREITSDEVFKGIGFNPEEIINVASADIAFYKDGQPLTLKSNYPLGALLQDKQTGGVYWVHDETKSPLSDRIFLDTKFKGKTITQVEETELARYTTIDPVKFDDGELLKAPSSPAVYLIADGQKRAFDSGETFVGLGYKWGNIISVPDKIINSYPLGELVTLE